MVAQTPFWMRLHDGGTNVFTGQHSEGIMVAENHETLAYNKQ